MRKLYEKNELTFALVWIGLYVVVMNIALQFCGGFDDLARKPQRRFWFRLSVSAFWRWFQRFGFCATVFLKSMVCAVSRATGHSFCILFR